MNIELVTQNSSFALELRSLSFAPEHGFSCQIRVQSGGFSADRPFWCSTAELARFREQLVEMDRTLRGESVLSTEYEMDFVKFSVDRSGHVTASGELYEFAEIEQHLKFGFVTDQTCLAPLVRQLSQALAAAAA